MKKFFTTLIGLIFLAIEVQAQQVEIRGIVKNARNGEGIEFLHVSLWRADSSIVGGVESDIKGCFFLSKIVPGDYTLAISGIGYRRQVVALDGLKSNVLLPDILLEEEIQELESATVTASNQINRIDRKVVFPTEQQLRASTNGVDLLMQLALPKVSVNLMTMSASLIGSGELQYRINGVKVELQDILSLQPASIIRIEYYDNPGLRYGNAEVVLDYIVYRPQTGGSGGLRTDNGFKWQFMNTQLNGRINHKKSEFSTNYMINYRDFNTMWRDNDEKFQLEDGATLHRKEEGEPGRLQYWRHSINTAYSYQNEKRMMNAAVRYDGNNDPHFDYKGVLYNVSNPQDRVKMIDNATSKTHRPAVDLYYQENLKNDQTLVLNLVGTYQYTDNHRFYDESREGVQLTHVDNSVIGKKYSWIGEGIYEKTIGTYRLTGGVRHAQSYSDNIYKNGHDYTTEMTQGTTFLFAELKGKIKKLDYMLGIGATIASFAQANKQEFGYSNVTFNPRFSLQYTLPGESSVRLRAEVSNMSPSLSELSAVDQTIDSLQIQRGNPSLTPYLRYFSQLTYNYRKGIVTLNAEGSLDVRPKAIMDEKFAQGTKIVQTWKNQKNFQQWNGVIGMKIEPVAKILHFSLRGGVRHFISNGNSYRHTYTNWFTVSNVMGMYKNAMIAVGIETNRDFFMGETMSGGENIHFVLAGYTYKNATLQFMVFNPFVDNYRQVNENRSQYASYRRMMYINDTSRFMFIRFHWNFSFGRSFDATQKRIHNADEDSGIMSTGK